MKNYFLIVAVLITSLLSSCKKENSGENQKSYNNTTKSEEVTWLNYYDNELVTSIDADKIVEFTFADYTTSTSYSFSTESLYLLWAVKQNYLIDNKKLDLVAIQQNLNLVGEYAINTQADVYYEQTGLIRSDMLDFMVSHGIKNDPTDVGVRQLWDYPNFQTSIHISAVLPWPSLGSARNKAESLKQIGVLCLNAYCDKTWFRGGRFYAFAFGGVFAVPDLKVVNWSNRFESISPL